MRICLTVHAHYLLLGYVWAVAAQLRNRQMHAMHGNGSVRLPGAAWRTGKMPEAKLLQDLQPVRALRAMGWKLPPDISDDYLLRVYDTRLEPVWLKGLFTELAAVGPTHVIGGDFLTAPDLEDSAAVNPVKVSSWGPAGKGPAIFHTASSTSRSMVDQSL